MVSLAHDGHEVRVLAGLAGNQVEVPGRGVVVVVRQAVGVHKVGVLTSQGGGAAVHLVHKGFDGPRHPLRQNVAALVG